MSQYNSRIPTPVFRWCRRTRRRHRCRQRAWSWLFFLRFGSRTPRLRDCLWCVFNSSRSCLGGCNYFRIFLCTHTLQKTVAVTTSAVQPKTIKSLLSHTWKDGAVPLIFASHFEIHVLNVEVFRSKAAPASKDVFAVWYSSRWKHAILKDIRQITVQEDSEHSNKLETNVFVTWQKSLVIYDMQHCLTLIQQWTLLVRQRTLFEDTPWTVLDLAQSLCLHLQQHLLPPTLSHSVSAHSLQTLPY